MEVKSTSCLADQCGCQASNVQPSEVIEPRRRVLRMLVGLVALLTGGRVSFADEVQVAVGDRLVKHNVESDPVALRAADIKPGKIVVAYPFDPSTKKIRNETRLNKILLLRIDKSKLDDESKSRAADDILAFSALCTHAGCDVNAWKKQTETMLCYCHGSEFDPYGSGTVKAGPAPRALPWLPVKLENEELVVAGSLSATPGAPA